MHVFARTDCEREWVSVGEYHTGSVCTCVFTVVKPAEKKCHRRVVLADDFQKKKKRQKCIAQNCNFHPKTNKAILLQSESEPLRELLCLLCQMA